MINDQDYDNDAVFTPNTLKLGEIHWYILKAANLMSGRTTLRKEVEGSKRFAEVEETDFGAEVGLDEINWWVFKKETDIHALKAQSTRALEAAQVLKKASALLKSAKPNSYGELLTILRRFAEDHANQIEMLRQYVLWLHARDVLAPTILFNYRVWGSTRMSDRWALIDATSPEEDGVVKLRHLTEIVLGLYSSHLRAIDRAIGEVIDDTDTDISYEFDGETSYPEWEVPTDRLVAVAARLVFDECAMFFMSLRDSLSNVMLDIMNFTSQRNLISSDSFWRAFVSKAVKTSKTETQLWDFKETLTLWRVDKPMERVRAKVAFSEDVASLANARGGVLIIGVTDHREVVGIGTTVREVESRLKVAKETIATHLEYSREITRFHQLILPDTTGAETICLIVIVAQAFEPVGVTDGEGRYTYPVRRETGIQRVSRGDLASRRHMKSDKYDFLSDLEQFVRDN
jgi:hypothetical protein